MKFCYLDETGKGEEPILIMAGIVVDSHRMHRTKEGWDGFLKYLSKEVGTEITEFHTKDFYPGNGIWRKFKGPQRALTISAIIKWIGDRRHSITFSAIDKKKFSTFVESGDGRSEFLKTPWIAAAVHSILALQKYGQKQKKTTGHMVAIFDRGNDVAVGEFVHDPPKWTDTYYQKGKKQDPLSHIVDVPYFVDSEKALLIQVADLMAYVLRLNAELTMGHASPKYRDEQNKLEEWTAQIIGLGLPPATRYPSKSRCDTTQLFWDLCPECLRK